MKIPFDRQIYRPNGMVIKDRDESGVLRNMTLGNLITSILMTGSNQDFAKAERGISLCRRIFDCMNKDSILDLKAEDITFLQEEIKTRQGLVDSIRVPACEMLDNPELFKGETEDKVSCHADLHISEAS